MSKVSTADFAKGMFIIYRDLPHQIVDMQFVNPGKGGAFVRTRLKNIQTGQVFEFTYKSGETVEGYTVNTREMQYLYKEGDGYVFMDPESYEQVTLSADLLGNFTNYIQESNTYQVLLHDTTPLGMRFPKKVRLKVVEAEEAVAGNTVSGAKKSVVLETGVRIFVPLFIKTGDLVGVNPETNEYQERVSQT